MTKRITADSDSNAHPVAAWIRWVGHSGFIAEGVIYLLIGDFALFAAIEPGRRPSGAKGALSGLADAPLGSAMLAILALGLAAFVLWQVIQAILDPEHPRDRGSPKRRAVRIGCLLNASLHGVLVAEAAWRLFGFGGAVDNGGAQVRWTARAMALPLGRWVIAAIGAGIGLFGIFQFYRAVTPSKVKRVDLTHTKLRGIIVVLGAVGFTARGVVFALIGAFLIDAAWRYNAAHATGIGGALAALKRQPYGPWLLGAVATGLMAYGLFQIFKERYRDFRAS